MTKGAGGDEAAAVFNSTVGTLLGIFVTPLWVLLLLGKSTKINVLQTIVNLIYRVVLPLAAGQALQRVPAVKPLLARVKPYFKSIQEMCIIFIVYVVFCST